MPSNIEIRFFADIFMFLWLFILMFQMGISVSAADIIASAANRALMLRSLIANFIIVPSAGLLLLLVFKPSPGIAVGFLTLIVFAGAPFGPPISGIARGNMPFSIGIMLILTLVSAALSPFLLTLISDYLPGTKTFRISQAEIFKVVISGQVVPIAAGLSVKEFRSDFAEKIFGSVKKLSGILTLGSFAVVLALDYKMLFIVELKALASMLGLFIISISSGWLMGGPDRNIRKSLAIITTIRNAAAALVIINASFPGSPAFASALTYSVFSVLGALIFAGIVEKLDTNNIN